MLNFSIKVDTRQAVKLLKQVEKQIGFAQTLALNRVAKSIFDAEKQGIVSTFWHPKPFTLTSVGITPAISPKKGILTRTIFIKPKAAIYLSPYENGDGTHYLPSRPELGRVLLVPVHAKVDAYGQFPNGAVARMLARPDVFVGTVHTVFGIWQRPPSGERRNGGRGTKGKLTLAPSGHGRTGLILLARIVPNRPVHKHLDFVKRGEALFLAQFPTEFEKAFVNAMATAK